MAYAPSGKFKDQSFKARDLFALHVHSNGLASFHESITPLHHATIKARKADLGKLMGKPLAFDNACVSRDVGALSTCEATLVAPVAVCVLELSRDKSLLT